MQSLEVEMSHVTVICIREVFSKSKSVNREIAARDFFTDFLGMKSKSPTRQARDCSRAKNFRIVRREQTVDEKRPTRATLRRGIGESRRPKVCKRCAEINLPRHKQRIWQLVERNLS